MLDAKPHLVTLARAMYSRVAEASRLRILQLTWHSLGRMLHLSTLQTPTSCPRLELASLHRCSSSLAVALLAPRFDLHFCLMYYSQNSSHWATIAARRFYRLQPCVYIYIYIRIFSASCIPLQCLKPHKLYAFNDPLFFDHLYLLLTSCLAAGILHI
jgi:hypothetical protein